MKFLDWIPTDILSEVETDLFSKNPNAVDYLEQHPEKIEWYNLFSNPNPNAIH